MKRIFFISFFFNPSYQEAGVHQELFCYPHTIYSSTANLICDSSFPLLPRNVFLTASLCPGIYGCRNVAKLNKNISIR